VNDELILRPGPNGHPRSSLAIVTIGIEIVRVTTIVSARVGIVVDPCTTGVDRFAASVFTLITRSDASRDEVGFATYPIVLVYKPAMPFECEVYVRAHQTPGALINDPGRSRVEESQLGEEVTIKED
jgi:hypothetical protein